jgi:hypothetical protein
VSYEFHRGETILVALDALSGDPQSVTAISAVLKPVAAGNAVAEDAPAIANFAVTPRPAADGQPAGWTLAITANASSAIVPGLYRTEARIEIGPAVLYSQPLDIRITRPLA